MKLASIINVWSDCVELLPFCIANHLQFADEVLVVSGVMSNHGNKNDAAHMFMKSQVNDRVHYAHFEPFIKYTPVVNETAKRNFGINHALDHKKYTHFLMADADEFYKPEEMNGLKKRFNDTELNGLIHPLKVYIQSPTLYTSDHTLVAGIHKLSYSVMCGNFQRYPFAYDHEGKAHIDPSRRLSYINGIEMSDVYMHHYSYVRKNIDLKIDNSSANLKNSRQVIYDELRNAKPGYISKLYHQPLQECPNYFDICI